MNGRARGLRGAGAIGVADMLVRQQQQTNQDSQRVDDPIPTAIGVPVSNIRVRFTDAPAEPTPVTETLADAPATSTAVLPDSIPGEVSPAGKRAWNASADWRVPVMDEPAFPLPSDGVMWREELRPDGTKVLVRHEPADEAPTAPFGQSYYRELVRRTLELEQDAVYQFVTLLDGHLKSQGLKDKSLWVASGGAGGQAISFVFQNLLSSAGVAGVAGPSVGSAVNKNEYLDRVKSSLLEGLESAAGDKATKALGIDTTAGRIAATLALDGSRRQALDYAERVVKITNSAKDLPDRLTGELVREVIGLGGEAVGSVAAGTRPAAPVVPLGDVAAPAALGGLSSGGAGSAPPRPPAGGAIAVPKGAGDRLVGMDRAKAALELAKQQIANPEYQLFRIMNDNPTEAKLKAWDILYFDGAKYVRPRTPATMAKDLEALRTIMRILNDSRGSTARDAAASSLISSYQAAENTGLLFIDATARAQINRAYQNIRHTHGNQSVPLISYMTQHAVRDRFAEYVACLYQQPAGAVAPRGSSATAAAHVAQNTYLLGEWLAECRFVGNRLLHPSHNFAQDEQRQRREQGVDLYVQSFGAYPTGEERVDRAKRARTLGEVAREREERERLERTITYLKSGSL